MTEGGVFFVTAGTYRKEHYFRGRQRLEVLHRGLLTVARDFHWNLEAWAVFSNHYHFVARSPESSANNLGRMLATLHFKMAAWINRLDAAPGRKVWHNFLETRLSFQRSYLARLNYVHCNAVKHGLVAVANQYPWCSAAWFEKVASAATVESIYRFKTANVRVEDRFPMLKEW